ncbi:bifunctional UDP-N-acetylmuramoyl-tripeptide:D-alanyl-D-alanine ligase/alanine racemase [Sphingobacterium sp. Mn56C]|uniref:bifunctional UDP-N-acetylmuramoyl-tripeptide:D-alanyl-D-alanine ligase/alanine racemase n=1 Tax=Sphingobacterium sp. Mn56C TaxID=3395261 RepID=UPI003BBEAC45
MYTITSVLDHIQQVKTYLSKPDSTFSVLAYDTRKIRSAGESLFFALQGQRDGHDFIAEAYAKGVRNFVVSDLTLDISSFTDTNFIWVNDTITAIQALAQQHREQFTIPVIGITGSNGKTIVKEWLYQLLSPEYNCYQSPKSYNSQLGVALSLWNITAEHELALIEAGISRTGEMINLQRMIKPTMGVFTSLGPAHREGFSSKAQKLEEKWTLFKAATLIVAPSASVMEAQLQDPRVLSWGARENDALQLLGLQDRGRSTLVQLRYMALTFDLDIPFVDKASIDNVLTCVLVLLQLGYAVPTIVERIPGLKPLEMRLKLKKGKDNSSIIDDTYSNDIASLQIALDFLAQQNQYETKKLVLSDFEGEEWSERFEKKLLDLLKPYRLDELFFVGQRLQALAGKMPGKLHFYNSTAELVAALPQLSFRDASVLIKGGRKYQLEAVGQALVEKSHDTVLEINLKAIEHNLQAYRAKLQPAVKMMAMVKAFSYGSGSFEIANALQFNKLDYLTVAYVDEGVELRRAGISVPIMVLSPHEGTFEELLRYNLEPEIYSLRILKSFNAFVRAKGRQDYPIHIKLDTGMHRLGFMPEEVDALLASLPDLDAIRVVSILSHLVGAGDPALRTFTEQQIALFKRYAAKLEQHLGYTALKHICNTSGIVNFPDAQLDMVRLGIGLYGIDMGDVGLDLEEVGVLKTTITQIKKLPQTETVGYDRRGVLYRDSIIATVKIGYADGYNRRFGNGIGKMRINGKIVPTVGSICMDMCMVDITDIDAKEGDEVVVFPDLQQAAKDIGTIPYELLTGISTRVKRIYFYE